MRDCRTSDELLFDFVDGIDVSLDEHVASCDECQGFLAELWQGELDTDLTEPIMHRIRLSEFAADVARMGADIMAAFGRAIVAYGPGVAEADAPLSEPESGLADESHE